jgi:hypothetical protein
MKHGESLATERKGLMDNVSAQLELHPGASEQAIKEMIEGVGMRLPQDYIDFLRRSNGAEGHGPDLFVILQPAEKVPEMTAGYGATEFCPGLVVIGGDGLGNIIGVDGRSHDPQQMEYVLLDPVWLDLDSASCQHRSRTLQDMLEHLATRF